MCQPSPLRVEERLEQFLLRLAWLELRHLETDLAPYGLTVNQAFALMSLARAGDTCPMTELAGAACRSQGTMTGIIDRLVRNGLVERKTDQADRRVVLVNLTPAGRDFLNSIRQARLDRLDAMLEGLPEAEREALCELLSNYVETLGV